MVNSGITGDRTTLVMFVSCEGATNEDPRILSTSSADESPNDFGKNH